jgi:hypothetical protein
MDEAEIVDAVSRLGEVEDLIGDANHFFYYRPPDGQTDYRFPFATLMTNNVNDDASDLHGPERTRLNIGVGRQEFERLFPDGEQGADYLAVDTLMPHPQYGRQFWIGVITPSPETWTRIEPYLRKSHADAQRRHERKAAGGPADTADEERG